MQYSFFFLLPGNFKLELPKHSLLQLSSIQLLLVPPSNQLAGFYLCNWNWNIMVIQELILSSGAKVDFFWFVWTFESLVALCCRNSKGFVVFKGGQNIMPRISAAGTGNEACSAQRAPQLQIRVSTWGSSVCACSFLSSLCPSFKTFTFQLITWTCILWLYNTTRSKCWCFNH